MEIQFAPDIQAKIDQLILETGRSPKDLFEDAFAGYEVELAETRQMLDSRYDDIASGRVQLIDGEEVFARLMENNEADRRKQNRP
jgi:predicted transcriptional regulator